jgi:hypothetical protein
MFWKEWGICDIDIPCLPSVRRSSGRQPTGGGLSAIFGHRIERNGGIWSGPMYRVHDYLEQREALRWQADTRPDYNTGIVCRSQVTS